MCRFKYVYDRDLVDSLNQKNLSSLVKLELVDVANKNKKVLTTLLVNCQPNYETPHNHNDHPSIAAQGLILV